MRRARQLGGIAIRQIAVNAPLLETGVPCDSSIPHQTQWFAQTIDRSSLVRSQDRGDISSNEVSMSIRMILATLAITAIVVSPPAVRADEASKEKIISEIFDITQSDKMLDQMFELMAGQMAAHMRAQGLDVDSELEAILDETWKEVSAELKKGFRPLTSRLWAKYFTEEELGQLLAFYRSDAGRKSIETAPQIMQEAMAWAHQELAGSLPRIKERVEARVKAAMEAREEDSNP